VFGDSGRIDKDLFIDKMSLDFAHYLSPVFLRNSVLEKVVGKEN
jgi:hypothetical protein